MADTRMLWVDDSKPEPLGCSVARTYDDAVRMLTRYDWDVLYLDHDLGEKRTGYELLLEMDFAGRVPATVICISWNPVGRARIEALWEEIVDRRAKPDPERDPQPARFGSVL